MSMSKFPKQAGISKAEAENVSQADSTYKGGLASQKYFTPQELNSLARVGKQPLFPRPASGSRKPKLADAQAKVVDVGNTSQTSFYSETPVSQEQEAKLKKIAKPLLSQKKESRPPTTGKSKREEEIDDLLSELSTPGLGDDLQAQKKYIDELINRGKKQAHQDMAQE